MWLVICISTVLIKSLVIFGNPIESLNCINNEEKCANSSVLCSPIKLLPPKYDTTGEYFYLNVSDVENMTGNKNWKVDTLESLTFDIIHQGSQNWIGKVKVWKTDSISVAVGRRHHGSAEGQWAAGDVIRLKNCQGTATHAEKSTSKPIKEKVKDIRLPTHLKPLHYRVSLVPFIIQGNFTIKGAISITLQATLSGPRNITLHTAETNITHKSVIVEELSSVDSNLVKLGDIDVTEHQFDIEREFFVVHLSKPIVKGNLYRISMDFTSSLNDDLHGFYRSSYQNKDKQTEYMAITQFQISDARRAFPCLDEPALKAKFNVSLGRTKDMMSLSNMPITKKGEKMEGTDDYVWDHYQESVPMSTYLVAFVVSKFKYVQSPPTGNNVTFRIWARESALDQVTYAKEIGGKMLQYFENYFNVTYPLPKQDLMACPDFSAGAMENWGLINYRESALLYKDGISTAYDKQIIAMVISHELSHQWFGNLVTPRWWTDLWLNEGFATYVSYLGVEAVQPDLNFLDQFVAKFETSFGSLGMHAVLGIDALSTSHPISIPVQHPDEIAEIFDTISYVKGASIIRMMNHFLTEKTFRNGITNYLKKFSFKAADQDDLWHSLTTQAHDDKTLPPNITVKEIMDTWTLQMGFPVLLVTRDYDSNKAKLTQKRFLLSSPLSSDTHNYKWWIPITFTSSGGDFNNTYNEIWMKDTENTKVIDGLPNQDEAAIFNIQQTGYYRVNYDDQNWRLIIQQLKKDHTKIHVINRAQIIDDVLNLARAGLLKYEMALEVTSYLKNEKDYLPWAAALSGIEYLDEMLKETTSYGDFKGYMRTLIDPLYQRLGYEMLPSDGHLDIFLRKLLVKWACKFDNPECKQKTNSKFLEWMEMMNPDKQKQNPINVNLRRSVYCNAIANGGQEEWDFAWDRYINSNVGTEKEMLLQALTCTKQIGIINRFLNMTLTKDSGIRKGDGPSVFSDIGKNLIGRDVAFDLVRDKWEFVVSYYGTQAFGLQKIFENILNNRNTQSTLDKIERFQSLNEATLGTAQREIKQAIEKTRGNIAWMANNYKHISDWLSEQMKNISSVPIPSNIE